MSANRLPYFPFDVFDYLNDPAVIGMDADTEGCYIRLMARSWQTPTPGIIADELVYEMAGFYRLSEQYRTLWQRGEGEPAELLDFQPDRDGPEDYGRARQGVVQSQLAKAFDLSCRPGFWVQRRMVREYQKLVATLEARQAGAAKTNANRPGNRDGDREITESSPPRTPTEEVEVDLEVDGDKSKQKPTSRSRARREVLLIPDQPPPPGVEPQTWTDWFAYRAQSKHPLTTLSAKMCAKQCRDFYEAGHDPDQIIATSIANGWRGLIVPTNERNGHGPQRR